MSHDALESDDLVGGDRVPIGLLQVWHSHSDGFWYARSAAFYELPVVQGFANWRPVPDTILIVFGALPLLWFLISTFPRMHKGGSAQQGAQG